MFNIKKVDVLTSQTGKGIKINGKTLGVARITEVDLPEDTTLFQVVQADGLTLAYTLDKTINVGSEGEESTEVMNVKFETESLEKASNYVLVIIDEGDNAHTVSNCSQITELFELPAEDAESLTKYIGSLADSRNLSIVHTEDLDGNKFFFFVNKFDQEMFDLYMEDNQTALVNVYISLQQSPEYYAEISNHNFVKMLLIGLAKAGQDRYNLSHRDKVLCDIAKQLSAIRYWNDGNLYKPSFKDIEDYIGEIKNQIVVE